MVQPASRNWRKVAASQATPRGSRPVAGSSSSKIDGSCSNRNALAHAARKGAHQRIATLEQTDLLQKFLHALRGIGSFLEAREEQEIFFGGEFVVDHGGVGDEAGGNSGLLAGSSLGNAAWSAVGSVGRARRVRRESELAGGGTHQTSRDSQQGSFSGAVPARERHALAGGDFKTDLAQGGKCAEPLFDIFETNASG
jgi:hypothetical protein